MPVILTALLMLVFVLVACTGNRSDDKKTQNGHVAEMPIRDTNDKSDVVLKRMDGSISRVSDYSGKFLFVTFWASWNNESREMIPIMSEIQKKFKKNVTVIGISMDTKSMGSLKSFLSNNSVKFDVFVDGERTANIFGGVKRLPTTYILLRDGKIANKIEGLKKRKNYEEAIISLYVQRL